MDVKTYFRCVNGFILTPLATAMGVMFLLEDKGPISTAIGVTCLIIAVTAAAHALYRGRK